MNMMKTPNQECIKGLNLNNHDEHYGINESTIITNSYDTAYKISDNVSRFLKYALKIKTGIKKVGKYYIIRFYKEAV